MTKMIVMMTSIHSMICGTSNAIGFISRYRKFLPQSVQFFCVAGSQNKVTVTDFYRGSSRVNKHLSERGYCKDVLLARSTQAEPLPVVRKARAERSYSSLVNKRRVYRIPPKALLLESTEAHSLKQARRKCSM